MRSIVFIAALLACAPAFADAPPDAMRIGPAAALDCVAARYRGEALRVRDDEDGLIQEVRWLTPASNVLQIELTGPGCRFLEVEGVGQTEARILPGPPR
ncbi:Cys/Met metabolism pyridoxal-phosphate-dependent enzyme [Roseicitreum antarcticum]|nr:Cys/Met metabolism pyridoxal-phosphate-dependent enzyme [Roseicitreum antarcticum]